MFANTLRRSRNLLRGNEDCADGMCVGRMSASLEYLGACQVWSNLKAHRQDYHQRRARPELYQN